MSLRKIFILTMLVALMLGFSIYAYGQEKTVSQELIQQTSFTPDNAPVSADGATAPTSNPTTKPNVWLQMLAELLNKVAAVAVPAGVIGLFAWITKKTGWDIPEALEKALEAFILNCIQEIKNTYGLEKKAIDLKMLCVNLVSKSINNKLLKYLNKKFGNVETAVEYYYQTSYKPVHAKR